MKKLLLPVILIALIGGGGYAYYVYSQPDEKPQVIKATVGKGDIVEVVVATGTLDPLRSVSVGSQVSGVVKELYVDYNSMVKEGMVLAEIDPTLLQSAVDQAAANLDKSTVDLERMKVQLEQYVHDQKRNQDLFEKKLVTEQTLEQANLNVKTQQATIASSEKGLVQLRANLDQAKTNLGYATIKSPIDGVVVSRIVDKGSTVQASMTTPQFFTLATDLTHMKLTGGVDESEIGKIHPGQLARFTVDAYQGQTFEGTVNSVRLNSTSQNNVVTYQTIIDVINPDLKLRPGMTAQIKIQISNATGVTKVPAAALRFRPSNDMYAGLGLEPPQRGGGPGANGRGTGANAGNQMAPTPAPGAASAGAPATTGAPAAPNAQGAPQMAQNTPAAGAAPTTGGDPSANPRSGGNRQPGQGGGNNRTGGGGGRSNFGSSLTPEQQKAWAEIQKLPRDQQAAALAKAGITFPSRGQGGGGAGRGGGNRGGASNASTGPVVTAVERGMAAGVDTIDKLYQELPRTEGRGTVWVANQDATTKKWELKNIQLRTGITDGQWTEVLSGDIQPGQELVTGIILPVAKTAPANGNPLMQQQNQRGGPGQGQPGGGGARGGGGGGRGGL
jgi:HlyD family secretion protein